MACAACAGKVDLKRVQADGDEDEPMGADRAVGVLRHRALTNRSYHGE
jgi:hypothetical protein